MLQLRNVIRASAPTVARFSAQRSIFTTSRSAGHHKTFLITTVTLATLGVAYTGCATLAADAPPPAVARKRVVVLGSGWASMSFLRSLSKQAAEEFDIVVISPRNYFVFSPLLPSVTVGTIEPRSICEPIRRFCKDGLIQYYESDCLSIDHKSNSVTCKNHDNIFSVPYDYLVVGVGAETNTFGTPGVAENCIFLKEVEDARRLRELVYERFEQASVPGISLEEKKRLLHFVVVGGGPTGVEFAGELHDHLHDDLHKLYPNLCKEIVKITIIQSGSHILNTFDRKISEYAEKSFSSQKIDVRTGARVIAVKDGAVQISTAAGKEDISFGVCLWATGIKARPLVQQLAKAIGPVQDNRLGLVSDNHLRVAGTDNVFALGDCCSVAQPLMLARFKELFAIADKDGSGNLDFSEFKELVDATSKVYPQIREYGLYIEQMFAEGDTNKDGVISIEEFAVLLEKVDKKLRSLPATAQVASQQGEYLAKTFNAMAKGEAFDSQTPFHYRHFGSFAYIGDEKAVMELPTGILSGWFTYWMWRGAYTIKQVSLRTKALTSVDWVRSKIFGRDTSRC
eukprot:TRINITY_DN8040_c0_g2_i1.p1 TRINITY_DN8040_c0_g2~~TRINITY_DN8040_c0_g2_i1.p1  ORF type:complete len:568 (+),score=127.28 TRINITY_DN8040_c0_g2_i1:188-1891(+)